MDMSLASSAEKKNILDGSAVYSPRLLKGKNEFSLQKKSSCYILKNKVILRAEPVPA